MKKKTLAAFGLMCAATAGLFMPHSVSAVVSWDKSSLSFDDSFGCKTAGCNNHIQAEVCDGIDSQPMSGPTTYEVWYSPTGNPKTGALVFTGTVPKLGSGECDTLYYWATKAGNYMFKVNQMPGHPGTGVLWSDQCQILTCEEPAPSPSPTVDPTPSPSVSPSPSPTPSALPTPTPTPSASPQGDPSPTPTPTTTPPSNSGHQSSLSNDNLQCTNNYFDAVMDLKDNGNGVKDVVVTFTYNGSTQQTTTNQDGRAKVRFGQNGNGSVSASANDYPSQSMYLTMPESCMPAHAEAPKSQGQVLGASTLASTGTATEGIAQIALMIGATVSGIATYGYIKTKNA
jgi:YqxM protein